MRRLRRRSISGRVPSTNVGAELATRHVVVERSPADKMADYDALPSDLRQLLGQVPLPVDPAQVLAQYQGGGVVGAALWLRGWFPHYRPI